jgi:hypothetical protein
MNTEKDAQITFLLQKIKLMEGENQPQKKEITKLPENKTYSKDQYLFTVAQLIAKHPAFKTGGLRSLIFNEHQNGLAKTGAIIRIGRKVLIDENKFFAWVTGG